MATPAKDKLEHMEGMLSQCRRRLLVAEVVRCLRETLPFYLVGLISLALLFFIIRVVAWLEQVSLGFTWVHVSAIAVGFGAITCARVIGQTLRENTGQAADAAERLDLSQSTHNRIATAMSLLRSADRSSFAGAAIRDGVDHLEKLKAAKPFIDTAVTSWRREACCLVLAVVLIAAGQYLEAEHQRIPDNLPVPRGSLPAAPGDPVVETARLEVDAERVSPLLYREKPARGRDLPVRKDEAGESDSGKRSEAGKESRSEGPAGQHASGKSRTSLSSSTSRSAASGAGVKSKPGTTESGKQKKPRPPRTKTAAPPAAKQKNQKGGAINARGSSGSGSMRTVQNEWSSEVKSRFGDTDDFEQEEEPDEEMDKDKQRLGLQPTLKNRSSRISRELSLVNGLGVNNDMIRGRGGPNAQKKSRGTATMIMGVPVPGFVKGRLLPGPTKSTQEEVEPTPREAAYASMTGLPPARPEEMPQERFRPPAVLGVQARDYLIHTHAEFENRQNGEAPDE